jgi:6-phosphogluconolactonase
VVPVESLAELSAPPYAQPAGKHAGAPAASTAQAGPEPRSKSANTSHFVYTGCRTSRERHARGDGINVYHMESVTGRWSHVQLVGGLVNPSFLAFDRSQRFLYTIHGDSSEISAYAIDPQTGQLSFINQQSTNGKNPVHLAFDPTNRFVVVPNHITSTLAVLPIDPGTGALGEVVDLVKLEGMIGPHRTEQPFAKPHQTEFAPDGRFIVVPDKGLDRVFTFGLDPTTGKLFPADPPSVVPRETSGPRHVAFNPSGTTAYVVNELNSTVTTYRYDALRGGLMPVQIVPTLPSSFTGNSRASEIGVSADGRFVYASNRGFDSIAVFSVDPGNDTLTAVDYTPSEGRTLRFILLDPSGRFMYVANEDSDSIVKFDVNATTGQLTPTKDVVKTGSPVCILFRKAGVATAHSPRLGDG